MEKIDITMLSLEELEDILKDMGEPKFRAKQIFIWLHQKLVDNFEQMSNISKALRDKLSDKFIIRKMEILDKLVSEDGTIKYIFKLEDGDIIESVLMRYSYGNAVCISSQVGCRMGCKFCASTLDGLERSLFASEMLRQIYKIQEDSNERVRSIVLMGSGEPFDNFDNFLKFIELINHKDGLNIGQRHITVSTCGLVPRIYEFADMQMQINLALSLHAPTDEKRKSIMPIANKYSLEEVVEACKYFASKTKRRVTYEYALISGVNDTDEDIENITRLLKGSLAHINLIPVNDVKERNYIKSSKEHIKQFANTLSKNGIETTVRRELGSDINAACGQLRRRYKY